MLVGTIIIKRPTYFLNNKIFHRIGKFLTENKMNTKILSIVWGRVLSCLWISKLNHGVPFAVVIVILSVFSLSLLAYDYLFFFTAIFITAIYFLSVGGAIALFLSLLRMLIRVASRAKSNALTLDSSLEEDQDIYIKKGQAAYLNGKYDEAFGNFLIAESKGELDDLYKMLKQQSMSRALLNSS